MRTFDDYERVSIGFPGVVRDGVVRTAPNLGTEQWAGFKFAATMERHLKRPTQVHNDADVQGLAAIEGRGLELVCTLGTGLGTAWFRDGELMPHMDLSHMAIHENDDFDHYIGDKTLKRIGKKEWNKRLKKLIDMLRDRVFLRPPASRRRQLALRRTQAAEERAHRLERNGHFRRRVRVDAEDQSAAAQEKEQELIAARRSLDQALMRPRLRTISIASSSDCS